MSTRRAGCVATRLSGSTEARRSKDPSTKREQSRRSIRWLIFCSLNRGDGDRPYRRLGRAVAIEGGANPSRGSGPKSALARTYSGERPVRLVQPWPAWGALKSATAGAGPVAGFGNPVKRGVAKSSTMSGAWALADVLIDPIRALRRLLDGPRRAPPISRR